MQLGTVPETAEFQRIQAAYREAWDRLATEVDHWRALVEKSPEHSMIAQAEDQVRRAEACYRQTRNLLADHLLARAAKASGCSPAITQCAGSAPSQASYTTTAAAYQA